MRRLMLAIVLSLLSTASFAEKQNNLFKCVDDTSLAINHECLSQKMETNDNFVTFQNNFAEQLSDLGGNVMATVIFYPELMETRVIAHMEKQLNNEMAQNVVVQRPAQDF